MLVLAAIVKLIPAAVLEALPAAALAAAPVARVAAPALIRTLMMATAMMAMASSLMTPTATVSDMAPAARAPVTDWVRPARRTLHRFCVRGKSAAAKQWPWTCRHSWRVQQ